MQIKIIVVGTVKEAFYQKKIEEFQSKIRKNLPLELICLKDESIPKQISDVVIRKIKETEGEKILSRIQNTDYVAALCIDGKKMDNSKIKKSIETAEQRGKTSIAFVIGGSLGLSDAVVKRADEKISFSNMTFPHQLMRVMLMEVLADTICGK
ncbi:23S rRNA (pseudouridine(1915)-N(3))-methyltransferase RlmH [Eubacterium sp. MSJ-21]|jgi:23S rRNA (pseudouridine1915-N3)-methyltransferase|nr:23S rRNA (pseudouridine(1915)-N(3))-methyltransferase RlmH [Eubacterium sp. MSJ-21]